VKAELAGRVEQLLFQTAREWDPQEWSEPRSGRDPWVVNLGKIRQKVQKFLAKAPSTTRLCRTAFLSSPRGDIGLKCERLTKHIMDL
jgi:hypothetical protein